MTAKPTRFDELNLSRLNLISAVDHADTNEWDVTFESQGRIVRVTCEVLPKYAVPHGLRIVMSPHHIRHWYVNRELDRIAAEHGTSELHYVMAVQGFVTQMGWQSWTSLATYDHRGVATKMLERHDKKFQSTLNVVRHPVDEQMYAAAQHAGLVPIIERTP